MDTTEGQYQVHWLSQVGSYSYGEFYTDWVQINDYTGSDSLNHTGMRNISLSTMDSYIRDQFVISSKGNTKLASKGSNISFSLNGIQMVMMGYNSSDKVVRYSHFNPSNMAEIGLYVYDKSGNSQKLDTSTADFNITSSNGTITIGGDFSEVPFDVYKMNIALIYYPRSCYDNNEGDSSLTSSSWNVSALYRGWGYVNSKLTINGDNNVSGLLSSLIALVQSIIQGLNSILGQIGTFMSNVANSFSELFSKLSGWFSSLLSKIGSFMESVGGWFSTLFQHIIDLPSKVWGVFEKGLKALFVPDEDFIAEYSSDWDKLLSNKFGCLYEAPALVYNVTENLLNGKPTFSPTISMPEVSIPLPGNNKFTFGGFDVDIVPDGFEFLVDLVKQIVNVVCTIAVIYTLKRRFDRINCSSR